MKTLRECVCVHSAAAWLLDNQPWDFSRVYFDAIDDFCHDSCVVVRPGGTGSARAISNFVRQGFHPDHLRLRRIPDIPAGPAIEHSDFRHSPRRHPSP
jgi:predicted HD phosphohydrolase